MKPSQVINFVVGLLSGSIVGAAVVILLAPQSGLKTRQLVASRVSEIIDSGKQVAAERRKELRRQYNAAIQIPLPPDEPQSD